MDNVHSDVWMLWGVSLLIFWNKKNHLSERLRILRLLAWLDWTIETFENDWIERLKVLDYSSMLEKKLCNVILS
jgi:hypothetical protein